MRETLGSRDVLVKITDRSLARGDIEFIDNARAGYSLRRALSGSVRAALPAVQPRRRVRAGAEVCRRAHHRRGR